MTAHVTKITSVAFSPNGQRIVSGGGDGTVKVWDLPAVPGDAADTSALTLKGHTRGVMAVVFTLMLVLGVTLLFQDIVSPLGNPFQ